MMKTYPVQLVSPAPLPETSPPTRYIVAIGTDADIRDFERAQAFSDCCVLVLHRGRGSQAQFVRPAIRLKGEHLSGHVLFVWSTEARWQREVCAYPVPIVLKK